MVVVLQGPGSGSGPRELMSLREHFASEGGVVPPSGTTTTFMVPTSQ